MTIRPTYIHLRDTPMVHINPMEKILKMEVAFSGEELGKENVAWEAHPEQHRKSANDRQVAGSHYKDMKIQPWDVIDSLPHAEAIGFYRGNALKYIMRAGEKGPAKEDYEKAIHYLEKLIETLI